jgi:two-component system, LuxR family, response regulator FixJ
MSVAEQTVFIVDNDESVRTTLYRLMNFNGWPVATYNTAEQFLDDFDPSRPGCLILNAHLPGLDGVELQKQLTKDKIAIPIIVVTTHADVPLAVQAMKMGAVDFLVKPYDNEVLCKRVRQAMALDAANRMNQLELTRIENRLNRLTPREYEVMELLVQGMSNKEVAGRLGLSIKTVEIHRAHIMSKMESTSLANLVQQVLTYKIFLKN